MLAWGITCMVSQRPRACWPGGAAGQAALLEAGGYLLEAGEEDREELEHVVPLAPAAPIAVEAAVQTVKTSFSIQHLQKKV